MKKFVPLILLTVFILSIPTTNTYAQAQCMENTQHISVDDEHPSISVGVLEGDISEEDIEDFINFLNDGEQPEKRSICLVHDYKYQGAVFAITHKVYASQPRCVEETYYLYECSKCGKRKYVLISSRRIVCCS